MELRKISTGYMFAIDQLIVKIKIDHTYKFTNAGLVGVLVNIVGIYGEESYYSSIGTLINNLQFLTDNN